MLDPFCPITFDPIRLEAQANHFRALAADMTDDAARERLCQRATLLDQLAANLAGEQPPASA